MNYALIFAGGTGQRMNSRTKPKQFLELHGKPIIIYTLEIFDMHPDIDGIVVACLESGIPLLRELIEKHSVKKVISIVPGGESGQRSICNGVEELYNICSEDSIVLVHDGVRPLITENTITENIQCVKKFGSSITVTPAIETVTIKNKDNCISEIIERSNCQMARAPQSFYLKDLYEAHQWAKSNKMKEYIDSASLMSAFGKKLYSVVGPSENIKITTPSDFYIFRAIMDAKENLQILGI